MDNFKKISLFVIENFNSRQSWWSNNQEWHQTELAILQCFFLLFSILTKNKSISQFLLLVSPSVYHFQSNCSLWKKSDHKSFFTQVSEESCYRHCLLMPSSKCSHFYYQRRESKSLTQKAVSLQIYAHRISSPKNLAVQICQKWGMMRRSGSAFFAWSATKILSKLLVNLLYKKNSIQRISSIRPIHPVPLIVLSIQNYFMVIWNGPEQTPWMKVDESGWKRMKVDESGWPWMKVERMDEIGWNWIKVDESGWKLLKVDEISVMLPASLIHFLWYIILSFIAKPWKKNMSLNLLLWAMRCGPQQAVGLIVSLFTRCHLPLPVGCLVRSVCLKVVIETVVTIWLPWGKWEN